MKLEIGTVPVEEVTLGRQTRNRDGALEVEADELLAPARASSGRASRRAS
jgi:hypothetical protein